MIDIFYLILSGKTTELVPVHRISCVNPELALTLLKNIVSPLALLECLCVFPADVPDNIGVCTDVVIRSYRKIGVVP
ncbi:DUF1287 domain-containing protein [Candidatus Electrothrix sp.]|uniref:DUF1287 domain-containing protein n=1 Tax=Candidatus Electrothrix sp. TaxID=2170559 RepID=UPI00405667BD